MFITACMCIRCRVLFACLPDEKVGAAVLLGPGGVSESGAPAGLVVVDNSTVDPSTARALSESLSAVGMAYFECPVLGGVDQAVTGELFAVVSGPDSRRRDCHFTLPPFHPY